MSSIKRYFLISCLLILCVTQCGCALFALPGQIIGGLFGLGSQALNFASGLPMPPPWMFL